MIRRRLLVEASCSSAGRSMTSLMRSSLTLGGEREPRKGFERIIIAHACHQAFGQMRRDGVVAVELPMRIIGGEQEHPVRADHLDDVGNPGRVGRAVERLGGK